MVCRAVPHTGKVPVPLYIYLDITLSVPYVSAYIPLYISPTTPDQPPQSAAIIQTCASLLLFAAGHSIHQCQLVEFQEARLFIIFLLRGASRDLVNFD